jgi:hypothetical protein
MSGARRIRIAALAALALAVPLKAGAVDGEGAGLSVAASLDYCGVAQTSIVCKIDASWSDVEGAEYYTASVTLADGSVQDIGDLGDAGSTSLWVPYAGDGTYMVTISAWGTDEEGTTRKLDQDNVTETPDQSFEAGPGSNQDPKDAGQDDGSAEEPAAGDSSDPAGEPPSEPEQPPEPAEPEAPAEPEEPTTPDCSALTSEQLALPEAQAAIAGGTCPDPASLPSPEDDVSEPGGDANAGSGASSG